MSRSYKGLEFETGLMAHWAAFFDLAGWQWDRGIAAIDNWKPDFRVSFPCAHSECSGSHTLLVSVLPVIDIEQVKGHPALEHIYEIKDDLGHWIAHAGALFGNSPDVSSWQMSHGSGGGIGTVHMWVDNAAQLWFEAHRVLRSVQ